MALCIYFLWVEDWIICSVGLQQKIMY